MPAYIVKFQKTVLGDNGQERKACQGTINVNASSEGDAVRQARSEFCRAHSTSDWTLYADCFEIVSADYPS